MFAKVSKMRSLAGTPKPQCACMLAKQQMSQLGFAGEISAEAQW